MAVNTKVEYLPFRERASQRLSTALSEASYQASSSASRARCSEVSPTLECEIVSPVAVRLERVGSNALQSTRKGREMVTPALDSRKAFSEPGSQTKGGLSTYRLIALSPGSRVDWSGCPHHGASGCPAGLALLFLHLGNLHY